MAWCRRFGLRPVGSGPSRDSRRARFLKPINLTRGRDDKALEAKYKIDRRMGENIWGRPKSPVNRREYGPGQHGQRRKGKLSDFGVQLRAKQKLQAATTPTSPSASSAASTTRRSA